MKLLFYSVAVIAMCLLHACKSNNGKPPGNADAASEQSDGFITQDVQLHAPGKQEEKIGNVAGDVVALKADTTTENINATVLQSGNPSTEDWDKKIIKTASVAVELKNYAVFNTAIHEKLKRYGAYIAGEQQTESDTRIENRLTIKVPVAQFEALMNNIGGDDIKVLEKSISTEDVTGEVVDTKARKEAKKQVRDKYLELLKQAKSMKDILAVQEEINGIQEDLEAASGRIAYLSHSAAYSTIHLTYYQYLNGNSANTAEPSFLTKIKEAFAIGGSIITNILLFIISVWPLALAGTILLLYVKKGRLKKA